jgi:hypothetical protein
LDKRELRLGRRLARACEVSGIETLFERRVLWIF